MKTPPRLQRVYNLLSDGIERSTLEISLAARVCAVNSIASELRDNGFIVECTRSRDPNTGQPIWLYRMPFPAPAFAAAVGKNRAAGDAPPTAQQS